ncbi:uncharacterized protein METZ01_LOCUS376311, partial [marine metagenome]
VDYVFVEKCCIKTLISRSYLSWLEPVKE